MAPLVGLCRIRLHAFVTSFQRKNDTTPSYAMTDNKKQKQKQKKNILLLEMTPACARFPRAFKAVNYCLIYNVL